MGNSPMLRYFITSIILSLTLVLFVNTANAQFNAVPTAVRDVVVTGGQMRMQVPFVVTNASNPGVRSYATRTIALSKATTGTLARARMFTPWGLALQAAMIGVGYYIDTSEDKLYVSDPADYLPTLPPGSAQINFLAAAGWAGTDCTGAPSPVIYPSFGHALTHVFTNCTSDSNYFTTDYLFNPDNQCALGTSMQWGPCLTTNPIRVLTISPVNGTDDFSPFDQITDQTVVDTNIEETNNPNPPEVTDEEITDAIAQSQYTTELIETTIADPESSRPVDINIAEIAAVIADLIADLEADNDADPLTVPTTDSDTDTGTATVTDVEPSQVTRPIPRIEDLTVLIEQEIAASLEVANPTPSETDPCAANPDSLMCLDTTGDFADTELTTIEIPFDITPIDLNGSETCPAPETLNMSIGSFQFDHQLICDALTQSKPIVVSIFSLMALFVIGGIRV